MQTAVVRLQAETPQSKALLDLRLGNMNEKMQSIESRMAERIEAIKVVIAEDQKDRKAERRFVLFTMGALAIGAAIRWALSGALSGFL